MAQELAEATRRDLLKYYDEIYGQLSRASCCPHLGADLTQETYFRAFRSIGGGQCPRNARAWLRTIARNVLRSYFRRCAARGVELPYEDSMCIDELQVELLQDAPAWECDPETLARALNALAPAARTLIVGFYFEGQGCRALGIANGIGRTNVKSRLFRARKKLRERLQASVEVRHG